MNATIPSPPSPSTEAPPSGERRATTRYRIVQRCHVWPATAPDGEGWRSIAYDLSTAGVGLALPLPLQAGTVLLIQPAGLPESKPVEARVVHSQPVEYLWFCGCEFVQPLREGELLAWLELPPGPVVPLPGDATP